MEKWRIYLILSGIVMMVYNIDLMYFKGLGINTANTIGVVASLIFVISLIATRKK
jgi:hypothetical protein